MYIMAPINMASDDYLGYWIPIDNKMIERIWSEVTKPIEAFIKDKFPVQAKSILEPPVRFIEPAKAPSFRSRALQARGMKDPAGRYNFMDVKILDSLYLTSDKPTPNSADDEPVTTRIAPKEDLTKDPLVVDCTVCIGAMGSPDLKILEGDIYGFFMAHFTSRINALFLSAFPNVHLMNHIGTFIMSCPNEDENDLTDEDVSDYLPSGHLTFIRLENVTFDAIDDKLRNMVKNHSRIIAENMIKRDLSFVHAVNAARKDGFEFPPFSENYPPTLSIWLRPSIGDIFCAVTIYKDGKLFDEVEMEMYGYEPERYYKDAVPGDPAKNLYWWYGILEEMNENPSVERWNIVITDLIHQ